MIKVGDKVRMTKLSSENEGLYDAGYWSEGVIHLFEVGRPVILERFARAGRSEGEPSVVNCYGILKSSTVQHITSYPDRAVIETSNSHWEVKKVKNE